MNVGGFLFFSTFLKTFSLYIDVLIWRHFLSNLTHYYCRCILHTPRCNFYGEDQNFQRVIIDWWRLSCQCLFPPLLAIFQRLWAPLLAAATSWLSSGWWWQAPIKASKANPTWEVFTCHIIEQNLTIHFDITSWCQGTPTWKTSLLFLLQYKTGAGPKAPKKPFHRKYPSSLSWPLTFV